MQSFSNCFPNSLFSIQQSAKTATAVIYDPRNGVVPAVLVLQPFCLSVSLAQRHLWPTHFAMMGTEFLSFCFFFLVRRVTWTLPSSWKCFLQCRKSLYDTPHVTPHCPLWARTLTAFSHAAPTLSEHPHAPRKWLFSSLNVWESQQRK